MPTTWNAIYLGVKASLDPTEGNTNAENAASLVGTTFGAANDKLFDEEVTVTTINVGGSGTALDQNNTAANDQISFDLGTGAVTTVFDSAVQYNGTITYTDGTTWTGIVVVAQDTLGNTFLVPQLNTGAAQTALVAKPIQSLTINSVAGSNFSGLGTNRQATDFLPCFVAGTRILTPSGERLIDDLRPGDLVMTLDSGPQPVRWIGRTGTVGQGDHAPIVFSSGAMGNLRKLSVSPQHRMLVTGWQAELLFDEAEVLVAAKHLLGLPGVAQVPCGPIDYLHLMFDHHNLLLAEGQWAESFFPGDMTVKGDSATRTEILSLFPDLERTPASFGPTARRVLRSREAALLVHSGMEMALAA